MTFIFEDCEIEFHLDYPSDSEMEMMSDWYIARYGNMKEIA